MSSASKLALQDSVSRFWRWRLEDTPDFASTVNVHTYDEHFETLTPAAYEKRSQICQEFLKSLDTSKINPSDLDKDDRLTYELYKVMLKTKVDGYKWRFHGAFNAVNFLECVPVDFVSFLIDSMLFKTTKDFEVYLKRLENVPQLLEDQIGLMKLCVEKKITLHEVSLHGAIKVLEKNGTCPPEDTVFYNPFRSQSESVCEGKNRVYSKIQQYECCRWILVH